ncbi:MAG: ELM1/GtrOC1 family putative glycosyltransferase [Pseudomonadota bacterium]
MNSVVVVTDRKPGHEKRSAAVARALGMPTPRYVGLKPQVCDIGIVEAQLRSKLLNSRAIERGAARQLLLQHTTLSDDDIDALSQSGTRTWAIATGTPPCTFTRYLTIATGVKTVVGGLRPASNLERHFDLCVCPFYHFHRGQRRSNLIATTLPPAHHYVRRTQATQREERHWLLAIGGSSAERVWSPDHVARQLELVITCARNASALLTVAFSRRTPTALAGAFRQQTGNDKGVRLLGADESFESALEDADKCFVTDDSESLLAEAINAGHRPGVLITSSRRRSVASAAMDKLIDWRLRAGRRNLGFLIRYAHRQGLSVCLRNEHDLRAFCEQPRERCAPNRFYAELEWTIKSRIQACPALV